MACYIYYFLVLSKKKKLLFGSHNLVTPIGYIWHHSVMNTYSLKLQIRYVFEINLAGLRVFVDFSVLLIVHLTAPFLNTSQLFTYQIKIGHFV